MGLIDTIIGSVKREISESSVRPTHYAIVHALYKKRKSDIPGAPGYDELSDKKSKTVEFKVPFKATDSDSSIPNNKAKAFIQSHPDHNTLKDAGFHLSSVEHKKSVAIKEHQEEVDAVIAEIEQQSNVIEFPIKENSGVSKMESSRPVSVILSFNRNNETESVEEGNYRARWDKANKSHLTDTQHNRMLYKKSFTPKGTASKAALNVLAAKANAAGKGGKVQEELVDEALGSMANIMKASKDAAKRSADPRYQPGDAPSWLKQAIKDRALKAAKDKDAEKVQKEETELEEGIEVDKKNYSWGKMITVHHGASHSYPLHPEHQKKIADLKDGEKTTFKDETKTNVTAHRDGDTIHLSADTHGSTKTPVARSHFTEEVEIDEAMPAGVIKHKQNISYLSDKEFAQKYSKDKYSDDKLRSMAWSHGYGGPGTPGHEKYVNRREKGLKEELDQIEEKLADEAKQKIKDAMTHKMERSSKAARALISLAKSNPKNMKEDAEQVEEKSLAALAPPRDKVTHKDVLVGRGVLKKHPKDPDKHVLAKEEAELEEARRGRPRKDGSKSDGDEEGGREHIIVQLRKAENLRGERHTEFNDNSKHKLALSHVKKALDMHSKMKPAQKGEFEARLAKSHSSFHDAVAGKPAEPAKPKITLAKSVREDVDPSTRRADRGAIEVRTIRKPDGSFVISKTTKGAVKTGDIIDAKESVDKFAKQYTDTEEAGEEKREGQTTPKGASADMTVNAAKYQKDPLVSKEKFKLPLTKGNQSPGGEDTEYVGGKYSVAEERLLNTLYSKLDESNKQLFNNLIQTKEGVAQLVEFAMEQGI